MIAQLPSELKTANLAKLDRFLFSSPYLDNLRYKIKPMRKSRKIVYFRVDKIMGKLN